MTTSVAINTIEPFPLIQVEGSPYQRGCSFGSQARSRVHQSIAHYREQAARWGLSNDAIASIIKGYTAVVERFDPCYLDEMKGIADGAGATFEDIFLLNARTEVLKLALKPSERRTLLDSESADGCTAVTVLPEATRDRQLIHAQNWDWKVECSATAVVLRIVRDDGPDILTFTEAGMLARSGFNSAGIAITGNNLESSLDYRGVGVPLPMIRRKALEASHLAVSMHTVYSTPKTGSSNMAVSHSEGVAINFECAPAETFQIEPRDGLLVHANHWESPVALGKLQDTGVAHSPCTLYRAQRVRSLLEKEAGKITADSVKRALLDDYQSPWSVCRPPRRDIDRDTMSATVATVVMSPGSGTMEIANLPAMNKDFTTYRLSDSCQENRMAQVR